MGDPLRATAELLVRRLHADGLESLAFATGPGLLRRLYEGGVDAVVVDPSLPSGSRQSILSRIRDAGVPVIAFSSNDTAEAVSTAIAQGANRYLIKGRTHPADLVAQLIELIPAKPPVTSAGYFVNLQTGGDAARLGQELGFAPGMRCRACGSAMSLYLKRDTAQWGEWMFGTFGCVTCVKRSEAPLEDAIVVDEIATHMGVDR